MSDIDKAVELARRYLDTPMAVEWCGCQECHDLRSPSARTLARAVLAMAAVVEAARKQSVAWWRDDAIDYQHWSDACHETEQAARDLDAEARRG